MQLCHTSLQFERTSMPITCTDKKIPSEQIANVLEKATHALNRAWLMEEINGSISALEAEFFVAGNAQIAKLRALVLDATHAELLAIFYLLLNIDAGLKTRMLALDAGNNKKIGRFVLDLRQELVVGFFCSPQTTAEFVQACGDGYCIA
jgi:hypothetical protein